MPFFKYGIEETTYLAKKDKRLGEVIEKIGLIQREVIPDMFQALVNSIIGQQISTKAQKTIWKRFTDALGEVTPEGLLAVPPATIQQLGISERKTAYILGIAEKVAGGELDLAALTEKSDEEVCKTLSSLKGIGIRTAEMLMIFSMQRPNIMSYGDLALHRGLRMLYHHRSIDEKKFKMYHKRFTPYATIASLYLWEIAGGAIPGMRDYAPKGSKREKK